MKLSQLISKYHSLNFSMRERDIENDPLGFEADEVFSRIERERPVDMDDVAALARLARHVIQVENDPVGALPLLQSIATWAANDGRRMEDYETLSAMAGAGEYKN